MIGAGSALRTRVRSWVLSAFPRDPARAVDYEHPQGDPGLFGPDSVTWRVHADFPGMLAGGLCALMLQTLHPRALAGVWDHSSFRQDMIGRLRRTTGFIAATTYAGSEVARTRIEQVRAIHQRVRGTLPDGRPYAADEPELLTWVHVTEAYAFLQGFRRYAPIALPAGAADAYFDEVRRVAEALGAQDVPASEADVAAYFRQVQPQLHYGERSRAVLQVLSGIRLPVPVPGLSRELFLGAGAALLPDWALAHIARPPARRLADRAAAATLAALGPVFRRALHDGVAPRACRRMGRDPRDLEHF